MANTEFREKYRVVATKQARAAGRKLFGNDRHRLGLIRELQELKYWPENKDRFEYEKIWGAIKFNFDHIEGKWIRVFVYPDEDRQIMWVIAVFAKKTNQLSVANQISVATAVSRVEQEIKIYRKKQDQAQRMSALQVIKGGKGS